MTDLTPEIDAFGNVLWAPIPAEKATELHPGLWVGSCAQWAGDPDLDPGHYDVILTVCGRGEETPRVGPDVQHRRMPLRDGAVVPDPDDLALIVAWVARHVRAGRVVLVRCWAGLNRSGLVGVLAAAELAGLTGAAALEDARRARSPWVLCNPAFAAYVESIPARSAPHPRSRLYADPEPVKGGTP